MQFSGQQLDIIEQALELAYEVQVRTFEENSNRAERGALQLAVRSYRQVRRLGALLAELRAHRRSAPARAITALIRHSSGATGTRNCTDAKFLLLKIVPGITIVFQPR